MSDIVLVQSDAAKVEEYTDRISGAWHRTVSSLIETAMYLREANDNLSKVEFRRLTKALNDRRVMSGPTISKLLAIASNPALTAPENVQKLPPSYSTLYAISHEDPEALKEAIEKGTLSPVTQLKEVKSLFGEVEVRSVAFGERPSSPSDVIKIVISAHKTELSDEKLAALRELIDTLQRDFNGIVEVRETGAVS